MESKIDQYVDALDDILGRVNSLKMRILDSKTHNLGVKVIRNESHNVPNSIRNPIKKASPSRKKISYLKPEKIGRFTVTYIPKEKNKERNYLQSSSLKGGKTRKNKPKK